MRFSVDDENKAAIKAAVSEGRVLKIKSKDGKLCKIIDVDLENNTVKCMPLYDSMNIYNHLSIDDVFNNGSTIVYTGGSKSRKHLSRKRKGKKSYRKRKYGKSKKSRRFRRSIRSRR